MHWQSVWISVTVKVMNKESCDGLNNSFYVEQWPEHIKV